MRETWVRKTLGEGTGDPLQYSRLENPTDRGLQSMGLQRVRQDLVTEHVGTSLTKYLNFRVCQLAGDHV